MIFDKKQNPDAPDLPPKQVAESMVWQDEGEVHAESAATCVEPDADAGVGPTQKSRLGGRQRW